MTFTDKCRLLGKRRGRRAPTATEGRLRAALLTRRSRAMTNSHKAAR